LLLKDTIAAEAEKLSGKVDASQKTVLERVEDLFDRKFMGAVGRIIAAGMAVYGAAIFLQSQGVSNRVIGVMTFIAAIALWLLTSFVGNRKKLS